MNSPDQIRNQEIDFFISENIKNFRCDKGWHNLIKLFLIELFDAGWNKSNQIFGKEKFGELRISLGNDPTQLMLNISRRYELLSQSVCELCGDPGKHRVINFWEQTLCTIHFLENYPVIKIENLHLSKVFRVNFELNYERVNLYTRGFLGLGKEDLYIIFHKTQLNYYALLKVIPREKLDDKDRLYIEHFFSELSDCEVCGFKAVFLDSCNYCNKSTWNYNSLVWPNSNYYTTKQDYLKEMQMDWYLDKDDFRKLKTTKETAFEPAPNRQIFFTDEDLTKYIKEQNEFDNDV
jgi:hypothetical protein